MAIAGFEDFKNGNPVNGGYGRKGYYATLDEFEGGSTASVADENSATSHAELIDVNGDHTFDVNKGFSEILLEPEESQGDAESIGSKFSPAYKHSVKGFIVGLDSTNLGLIQRLAGRPLICLMPRKNCGSGEYQQLGSECFPAYIKGTPKTGKLSDGRVGIEVEIMCETPSIFLKYTGTVTPKP